MIDFMDMKRLSVRVVYWLMFILLSIQDLFPLHCRIQMNIEVGLEQPLRMCGVDEKVETKTLDTSFKVLC